MRAFWRHRPGTFVSTFQSPHSNEMPKSRQRKTPITHATDKATRSEILSSKPKSSRTVIRKFHNLLKIRTQLEQNFPINEPTIRLIDREMEDLGGLERYQHMSNIGQGTDRGGGSENVFIGWLKELDVHKASAQNKKRSVAQDHGDPFIYHST